MKISISRSLLTSIKTGHLTRTRDTIHVYCYSVFSGLERFKKQSILLVLYLGHLFLGSFKPRTFVTILTYSLAERLTLWPLTTAGRV